MGRIQAAGRRLETSHSGAKNRASRDLGYRKKGEREKAITVNIKILIAVCANDLSNKRRRCLIFE